MWIQQENEGKKPLQIQNHFECLFVCLFMEGILYNVFVQYLNKASQMNACPCMDLSNGFSLLFSVSAFGIATLSGFRAS